MGDTSDNPRINFTPPQDKKRHKIGRNRSSSDSSNSCQLFSEGNNSNQTFSTNVTEHAFHMSQKIFYSVHQDLMVREKRMVEKERMCEAKVSQRYEELKQFEKDLKKKEEEIYKYHADYLNYLKKNGLNISSMKEFSNVSNNTDNSS